MGYQFNGDNTTINNSMRTILAIIISKYIYIYIYNNYYGILSILRQFTF